MLITRQLLKRCGVSAKNAAKYVDDLNFWLPPHGIDDARRVRHFLTQACHETAMLTRMGENLNYSAKRLLEVFPKYFTPTEAKLHEGYPEVIANRVYADRYGNGSEVSKDGWTFRGRGLPMLTFRENYEAFHLWYHGWAKAAPLEPDAVSGELAVAAGVFFWTTRDLNRFADKDDLEGITRRVNGGLTGFASRAKIDAKLAAIGDLWRRLEEVVA